MNFFKTSLLLAALTALFMAIGYSLAGQIGMLIALAIAGALNFYSYWNADKMVLRMHQAVEVGPENAPEFHEIVRRLAEAAQLPMPKTYILNSPQPNAFATGRNPANAAIAASTGLLESLSPQEVAAVLAHEMAHIASRDTLTMTVTATLAGAISMLGNFAYFNSGGRYGSRRQGGLATLLAVLVAPFAALIVRLAISRTREYAADQHGAKLCGEPLWLASALKKIAAAAGRTPNLLAQQHPATAHLFIINPLGKSARDSLFSTHPATENRVAALQQLEHEMRAADAMPADREAPVSAGEPQNASVAAPPGGPEQATRADGRWGRKPGDIGKGPWS